ncbi:MAG: S-layer homology domain-containing protein [Armatimonadetes bacterium]|nr:S-layer homology domain-containing protein [Armatimonadota bacterium]
MNSEIRWKTLRGGLALGLLWVVLAAAGAFAAPMFPDVPDMWATDAVRALAAKGMLEGYPDGTFKGDRAATRYETALIIARFLSRQEQLMANFASKTDLDEVRRLAESYAQELDAYGIKTTQLEDQYALLDKRVTELERINFYGNLRANGTFNNTAGARFIGTTANPAIDYTNGRLIFNGQGYTSRALLGVLTKLTDQIDGGLEVIGYAGTGSEAVEQYWGVTPPYNSNPFLSQASVQPFQQPDSNQPYNRMSLDRFWMQDRGRDYQLVIGTYALRNVGDQVVLGIRNPNVHSPAVLPFWGFDVTPLQTTDKIQWEFAGARLPQGGLYETWLGTTAARYDFGPVQFGISLARMVNEPNADGQALGSGLVILPTANAFPLVWRDNRSGALRRFVGPQDQSIVGANLNATLIAKKFSLRAAFGHSSYNPDKSKELLDAHPGGQMYTYGLQGVFGQFRADFDWVYADPTYDTMMLPYNVNPGFPIFLPYGNWYSSHYQLHDYLKYPINRRGPRAALNFANDSTRAFISYENLRQVKPTTFQQLTTPGNAEPLFPLLLTPGVDSMGHTTTFGAGFLHQWGDRWRVAGSFYDYNLRRASVPIDDVDFGQRFYRVEIGKAVTENLDVALHYSLLDFSGHTGLLNRSFEQTIPAVTLTWTPARNASITLEGRLLNFKDRLVGANNWHGNQIQADFNIDF